jgi:hypothetical protein
MSKEKTVEELAGKLDVIRAKTAVIRELNSAIRLRLMEWKLEGANPSKSTNDAIKRLKQQRRRLIFSVMSLLGHGKG